MSMSVLGGSDYFVAGTYKVSDNTLPHPIKCITSYDALNITSMRHRLPDTVNKVSTITLSGSSGTAHIVMGAYIYLLSFVTNLYITAGNFVTAFASSFLEKGVTLTRGTTAQVETITLSGSSGTANVTGTGGLTKLATFTTDLATTATNFVTSHAAAYLAVGVVVTANAGTLVFTANVPGVAFTAPVITNATTDLAGTVSHTTASAVSLIFTSTKVLFDTPTITNVTSNVAGTVVTTGADGLVVLTKHFLGLTLNAGTDIYFEYPVEEIVIGTGIGMLHFVK